MVFIKARATINNFVYGCGLPFMALLELMWSETILASNFDKAPLVVQTNNDQKYQLQNTKNIVPNHKNSKKSMYNIATQLLKKVVVKFGILNLTIF